MAHAPTHAHKHNLGKLAFIAGALLLLWWLWQRRLAQATQDDSIQAPEPAADPMTTVYASDPSRFDPGSLGTVDINIGNQGLNYLSNEYIPLFGFVGMAQGVMFQ